MGKRNKASKKTAEPTKSTSAPQEQDAFEGERLDLLLEAIRGRIEKARSLDGNALPEKIWFKQQFAVGVNEVTRLLEGMPLPPSSDAISCRPTSYVASGDDTTSHLQLQAVLLASDCHPRWLNRHLLSLASSRNVPLIFVKDKKRGSIRLGELVKLKTAIAIGVKAKGNAINDIIEKILGGSYFNVE